MQWNLSQDEHGHIVFPNPNGDDAILHRPSTQSTDSSVTATKTFSFGFALQHSFAVETPTVCGLDVREDTRCDDARSLLFGDSTSVGQICSIAEAVTTNPETALPELLPDNMPGTCCLDNVGTLQNFGERVSHASLSLVILVLNHINFF